MISYDPGVFDSVIAGEHSYERCGLLLGSIFQDDNSDVGLSWRVAKIVELRNVSKRPGTGFALNAHDVTLAVSKSGYHGIGFWHTHPVGHSAIPSRHDHAEMSKYPRSLGVVVQAPTMTLVWFNHDRVLHTERLTNAKRNPALS